MARFLILKNIIQFISLAVWLSFWGLHRAQAEVVVEPDDLANNKSYFERRKMWAVNVGVGILTDSSQKQRDSVIEGGVRIKAGRFLDFGGLYSWQFAAGFEQHIWSLGFWMPFFFPEPILVPFAHWNYNVTSYSQVSSYSAVETGLMLSLNTLEPKEGFRLRRDWGLEQVYLKASYLVSVSSEVAFEGFRLSLIVEF